MMKVDSIKKFVELRQALLKERTTLEARLAQINQALESGDVPAAASVAAVASPSAPRKGKRGPRAKNQLSLKEAVLQATSAKPLTKQEILEAITKLGYRFTAKDPVNSLNTVLYSKKQFKNVDGKFSPVGA